MASDFPLSSRAEIFLHVNNRFDYSRKQVAGLSNQYNDPNSDNPHNVEDGKDQLSYILMAVAENKLLSNVLLEKMKCFQGDDTNVLNYTDPTGLPSCKAAMASFMQRYLFNGASVSVNDIIIAPGCCALLHQLSCLLCETGDSILVPAPYYPAFDPDLWNIANVMTYEVHNPSGDMDISYDLSLSALQAAYERGTSEGQIFKAILLTNPNNPLGTIYQSSDILAVISWARSLGLHVIMDEIYALSTFQIDQTGNMADNGFISIVSLLNNDLGDNVHVIWSLSKDFGASGLRCGVIYSQNRKLLRAMAGMNDAFQVSNWVQQCVAYILQDIVFLDSYILANRIALRTSYNVIVAELKAIQVPVIQSKTGVASGIFVFANFRKYLKENSFDAERDLFEAFASAGVVMTPGFSCHAQTPGFFRICYAWVPLESLVEAIRRIKQIVGII